MFYILINHTFTNEIQSVSQIFYPNERFLPAAEPCEGVTVESALMRTYVKTRIYADKILRSENVTPIDAAFSSDSKKSAKYAAAKSAYLAFCEICRITSPWGIALGIRPTKMVAQMRAEGLSQSAVREKLKNLFLVSDEKARLAVETSDVSRDIVRQTPPDAVSLYVGVPFCPSLCLYCSFSSYIYKKYAAAADNYLNALFHEIEAVLPYLRGKTLSAVFIGGGTPASLSPRELSALLGFIGKNVNITNDTEYTLEAGRPDAIDGEKLRLFKSFGVTRLCVNPQTLNDATLKLIGRSHTADMFLRVYAEAEKLGFSLNCDVIAGLCGENFYDFKNTLDTLLALAPDNITVHTLCVKRASPLKERLSEARFAEAGEARKMLSFAYARCAEYKMFPYYMYRQKNTLGNLENVGYAKKNAECLYNIFITEEKQTVAGVGAGAVTKRYEPETNRITRVFNPKTPEQYIKRSDEITERKRNFL